jgi:hypothetical protein
MNARIVAALAALALAACGGSKKTTPRPTLADYVPRVATVGGTEASKVCTALPAEGAGPTFVATAPAALLPGGSGYFGVVGSAAFDEVLVAVQGLDCYWLLPVPSGTSGTVVISAGQRAPATLDLVLGVASGGTHGPRQVVPVALTSVGTGKLQVSVTWDAPSDVDLHLVEPGGEEIYYGNDVSAAGGTLDLDSNPACSIDGVNNENITYGAKEPPSGTYTVRLDYYDGCAVSASNYVVTVTVRGSTQTFTGTFTGPGDEGGAGDGVTITTFTY